MQPSEFPNLVVAGYGSNNIQVICRSGPHGLCGGRSVNVGAASDAYILAGSGAAVNSGDGLSASTAGVAHPTATAVDSHGNVIIADPSFHTVRAVCMSSQGVCAGLTDGIRLYARGEPGGDRPVEKGHIYHLAGVWSSGPLNTNYGYGTGPGCNGSGEGAWANQACLNQPYGVAVDSADNVLIADTMNRRLRVVCMSGAQGPFCGALNAEPGAIYSLAQGLDSPLSVAVDSHDNVAVTDAGNFRVKMVCAGSQGLCAHAQAGEVITVAGTENWGGSIAGIGFDSRDDLLVSDPGRATVSCVGTDCSKSVVWRGGYPMHALGYDGQLVIMDGSGGTAGGVRYLFR